MCTWGYTSWFQVDSSSREDQVPIYSPVLWTFICRCGHLPQGMGEFSKNAVSALGSWALDTRQNPIEFQVILQKVKVHIAHFDSNQKPKVLQATRSFLIKEEKKTLIFFRGRTYATQKQTALSRKDCFIWAFKWSIKISAVIPPFIFIMLWNLHSASHAFSLFLQCKKIERRISIISSFYREGNVAPNHDATYTRSTSWKAGQKTRTQVFWGSYSPEQFLVPLTK